VGTDSNPVREVIDEMRAEQDALPAPFYDVFNNSVICLHI